MESLPFSHLGEYGVAGALALSLILTHFHLMKVVIPNLVNNFREEMKLERDAHDKHISLVVGRIETLERTVLDRLPEREERPAYPFRQRNQNP